MPKLVGSTLTGLQVAVPTSYRLNYVNLTNHNGDTTDIQALVTDFSIAESIYLPSLILTVNVKDNVNFLEEFQLSGQEQISIGISRAKEFGTDEEVTLDLDFYVTEYPTYGKFNNHTQVYAIKGISEHAYRSKFNKISRAFSGNAKDLIYSILTQDLNYSDEWIDVSGKDMLNASLIVPNLAPIDAIAWILRRCYDQTGSPWYCYETMKEGIAIYPQSELVAGDIFRTFEEGKFFKFDIFSVEDYRERQRRILSMASDMRMSKYIGGAKGAYGSRSVYVDIAKKTIGSHRFNYNDDYDEMVWLNDKSSNLDEDFGFDQKSIATMHDAQINYIPTNSMAFERSKNYHSGTADGRINRAQSYLENLDNLTHEIKVAGDFGLSAGKVVELLIPKAIDPTVDIQNAKKTIISQIYDDVISGKYLITSVVHNFGEEYFCDIKIKKDSLSKGAKYY